jgi:uncharacterized protein (TIGR03437 family)
VTDSLAATAAATFSIDVGTGQAPTITALIPDSGVPGTIVVASGSNFEASQGSGSVLVNGAAATILQWSNSTIVFVIPASVSAGTIPVTVTAGQSSSAEFTVTSASCSSD